MIKCECLTGEGSETCQKSKLAPLQVYFPMESLINILLENHMIFEIIKEKRKKKPIKIIIKKHLHGWKKNLTLNYLSFRLFLVHNLSRNAVLSLTELWILKGNYYAQISKPWSWACTLVFQGKYRKLKNSATTSSWWTVVTGDQSDYNQV